MASMAGYSVCSPKSNCKVLLAGTGSEQESADTKASERIQRQHELQNMQGIEDISILEDLAEAEEEYDKPDQVRTVQHASSIATAIKQNSAAAQQVRLCTM